MVFDSITSAVKYIRDSWNKFTTAGHTLQARISSIQSLIDKAQKANDQTSLGKLIVAKSQAQASLREYETFIQKLGPFRSYFISENQLGILPVWIIASAGALATSLYLFFEKIKNEGKALELIEKGMLTAGQATSILSGGGMSETIGNAGKLVMWGSIAYALFMFAPMLKKVKG